jgi:hypothetical protein
MSKIAIALFHPRIEANDTSVRLSPRYATNNVAFALMAKAQSAQHLIKDKLKPSRKPVHDKVA